jgi:hypothetical protein
MTLCRRSLKNYWLFVVDVPYKKTCMPIYNFKIIDMVKNKPTKGITILDSHRVCNDIFTAVHKNEIAKEWQHIIVDISISNPHKGTSYLRNMIVNRILKHEKITRNKMKHGIYIYNELHKANLIAYERKKFGDIMKEVLYKLT